MIQPTISGRWTTAEEGMPWQTLALDLVDRLPFGVILTHRHGRIIEMNSRASILVAGENGLRVVDGKITAAACLAAAALQRAIDAAVDPPGGKSSREPRVTVPVMYTHGTIQVVVSPGIHPGMAVLFLFGPGRFAAEVTVLMDLYGLTPAEAQVACRLAAGESPAKIGNDVGTTLNTVRTHIRRIFTKTGCRTQAEFMHAVLTGPAALASNPA
jgi:DNA-binding CsgD family transcriptional regulator